MTVLEFPLALKSLKLGSHFITFLMDIRKKWIASPNEGIYCHKNPKRPLSIVFVV